MMMMRSLRICLARRLFGVAIRKAAASTSNFCTGTSLPDYTSQRFPHVKRGQYAKLTDEDISFFQHLLPGEQRVLDVKEELNAYNTDWLRTVRGEGSLVLRPKTTEEVSEIMKYCNKKSLAICTQGGNTGLVGGSVPVFDEIVLSTQLMNQIISVNEVSGILICQSGCVLQKLDDHLEQYDLMMPLDLAAKGSCQIGGNISTNAGGIRLLRYGSLHGSVLGVEAVLANGEVLDCLSINRKDNTGYDLKQLFIGSEGTLGIVTKASILCPQRPKAVHLAFLGLTSYSHLLEILREAKADLAEILSAFEFLDHESMECVTKNLKLSNPISDCSFYCVIETSGSNASHDQEKLTAFIENNMSSGKIIDGTMATEGAKIQHLWQFRERIAEGLLVDGYNFKYDMSLPADLFHEFLQVCRKRLGGRVTRTVGYGHVGDGNLHLNFTVPEYNREVHNMIEPFVYEWVAENRGSVSAEHGMGFHKKNYIGYSKTAAAVKLMQQLKTVMDPNIILNPYKTIPYAN